MDLLKALMYFNILVYCLAFWALVFLPCWIFLLAEAAAIGIMIIVAWLCDQEQIDRYDYEP